MHCPRVGMVFLPNDDKLAAEGKDIVETVVRKEGRCKITAWREVPVDKTVVGRMAKLTEPRGRPGEGCSTQHAPCVYGLTNVS